MDIWAALDHPVLLTAGLIVLAVVLSLAWAMLRVGFVLMKGAPTSGVDLGAIVTAWRQRPKASDVVDVPQLQAMIQEAIAGAEGVEVSGDTKESRIAALEALHAQGRITDEKLSQLKAAIAAED